MFASMIDACQRSFLPISKNDEGNVESTDRCIYFCTFQIGLFYRLRVEKIREELNFWLIWRFDVLKEKRTPNNEFIFSRFLKSCIFAIFTIGKLYGTREKQTFFNFFFCAFSRCVHFLDSRTKFLAVNLSWNRVFCICCSADCPIPIF